MHTVASFLYFYIYIYVKKKCDSMSGDILQTHSPTLLMKTLLLV